MSLINDALKRAKQAQDNQPPPPLAGAPLHAAPAAPSARWILPVIGLLVLLAAGAAALLWSEHGGQPQSAPATATALPPPPATAVVPPAPVPTPKLSAPAKTATPATQGLAATETILPTNAPATPVVAAAPQPQPPELKLQGILYRTDKPEAIINGRTLLVGSHLGEVEITRITQDEVTAVWRKQTIRLKLE